MTDLVFKTEKIKENSYVHYHVGRKPNTLQALPYIIVGNPDQMSTTGEWLSLDEAKKLADTINGFLKEAKKKEPKEEKAPEPSEPTGDVKEEDKPAPKKKSKAKKSEATPAQVEDDAQ